jgi:hypothetical protein
MSRVQYGQSFLGKKWKSTYGEYAMTEKWVYVGVFICHKYGCISE